MMIYYFFLSGILAIGEETAAEHVPHQQEIERNANRESRQQRICRPRYSFEESHQCCLHPEIYKMRQRET